MMSRCRADGCEFFGTETLDGYCSSCGKHKRPSDTCTTLSDAGDTSRPDNAARVCIICNRKVRLSVPPCRCAQSLCHVHVFASAHACTFDYRGHHREQISLKNPKITPNKLR